MCLAACVVLEYHDDHYPGGLRQYYKDFYEAVYTQPHDDSLPQPDHGTLPLTERPIVYGLRGHYAGKVFAVRTATEFGSWGVVRYAPRSELSSFICDTCSFHRRGCKHIELFNASEGMPAMAAEQSPQQGSTKRCPNS
eukprot:129071-Chlamydomonas_euryale.AAC.1